MNYITAKCNIFCYTTVSPTHSRNTIVSSRAQLNTRTECHSSPSTSSISIPSPSTTVYYHNTISRHLHSSNTPPSFTRLANVKGHKCYTMNSVNFGRCRRQNTCTVRIIIIIISLVTYVFFSCVLPSALK